MLFYDVRLYPSTMKPTICLLFILVQFFSQKGFAQELFSLKKTDSLSVDSRSSIVSNNLYLQNTRSKKITLNIVIDNPESWKIIGSKTHTISLDSNQEEVIPVSAFKMPGAVFKWEEIRIIITNDLSDDTASSTYTHHLFINSAFRR